MSQLSPNRCIILESPDRCGKDTQISLLIDKICDRPTHIVNVKPPRRFCDDIKPYLHSYFMDMFSLMSEAYIKNRNLIFNRAHIGDYVYGPMYRKYDADYIFEIEKYWSYSNFFRNIRLVTLIDKPEVLISREDGDSHSCKIDDKTEEIKRFIEATNRSIIKNTIIDCNNKNPQQIHIEMCDFLKDII